MIQPIHYDNLVTWHVGASNDHTYFIKLIDSNVCSNVYVTKSLGTKADVQSLISALQKLIA